MQTHTKSIANVNGGRAMKKQHCISVDDVLWEMAGENLPMSRSEFIEQQLTLYLQIDDPEAKIVEQITQKEQELNALKQKLCDLRKNKELKMSNKNLFDDAEQEVQLLYERQGEKIGKNQIRKIAKRFNVPVLEFENKILQKEEYNIYNYMTVEASKMK